MSAWSLEENCIRGVWEGRCAVKGCDHIIRLEGAWGWQPRFPKCFHMASSRSGALDNGWVYFHSGYLSYLSSPKIRFDSMLICSEHVQAWNEYCDALEQWEKQERKERKTWWQALTAPFRGQKPPHAPLPVCPFAVSDQESV